MDDRPNYGLNQREPAFTKIEVGLAVLLSILIYTVLWGFGVLVGALFPIILTVILVVAFYFAPIMIQTPKLRPLATDISLSVLVGLLNKLIALAGIGTIGLPLISVLLGGVITGIIRHQYFRQYTRKKPIKYSFLLVLILGMLVSASIGLYAYYFRIDIPVAHLRPAKVVKGWTLTEEVSGSRWTEVKYKKAHSSLTISASRFPGPPKNKEGYKDEAEVNMQRIKPTASLFGSDMTVALTREEVSKFNGSPRYIFRYDFGHQGKGLPMGAMIQYFWYCDRLQTNFRATSLIDHTPAEEYLTEVEQMVGSVKCP
jgi:hypothetical protein